MRASRRVFVLVLVAWVAGCGTEKKRRSRGEEADGAGAGAPGPGDAYRLRSMTAEAKNTLGAISRSAVASFERESVVDVLDATPKHELCKSAPPVPGILPTGGQRYKPEPGKDFDQGDATSGWRCLRFTMTEPFRYRYEYRTAPPWKGTARGGPDPGPGGFEASAEGDLDGDGKTSLFVQTGRLKDGALVLSTELFVVDELE